MSWEIYLLIYFMVLYQRTKQTWLSALKVLIYCSSINYICTTLLKVIGLHKCDRISCKRNGTSTGSIFCTAEAHSEEGNSLNVQRIDMLKLNHLNLHYHEMCGPVLLITNDFSFSLISFLLTCRQKPVWVTCACEASDNSNWRTPQVKYYPWQLLDLAHFCLMDALSGTKRERGGGQKGS